MRKLDAAGPTAMRDSIKAFYDQKYTKSREVPRTSKQFTVDCVPADKILDVLDIGCGSGANSLALAQKGHRLHGVDISEVAIEQYCRHGFDGRVADIESGLDYPDASFDLAFCSEVIEHMTSPEILASEISRILKPGGQLVLLDPQLCVLVISIARPFRLYGQRASAPQALSILFTTFTDQAIGDQGPTSKAGSGSKYVFDPAGSAPAV